MPLVSRIVGLHIVILGMLWVALSSSRGNIWMFLDVPSLLIVVLFLVGCSLICFTPAELADALRAVTTGPGEADDRQRRRRVAVMNNAYQVAWGAGIVGTFIGLIAMLADLRNPVASGAGLAVTLLTTLYGALLAEFIFAPLRQVLLNQLDPTDGPSRESIVPPRAAGGSGLWRGAAVVLLMVSCFFVLMVSFSEINREAQFNVVVDHIKASFADEAESVADAND